MSLKVLAPAALGVLFWPQAASAGGIGDLLCALLGVCGGGGSGGGSTAVPEIDGSAGLAVMALVACAGAILYRKTRG
jgi:hypothetical protein